MCVSGVMRVQLVELCQWGNESAACRGVWQWGNESAACRGVCQWGNESAACGVVSVG